jgi:hypothetical protein
VDLVDQQLTKMEITKVRTKVLVVVELVESQLAVPQILHLTAVLVVNILNLLNGVLLLAGLLVAVVVDTTAQVL